MEPLKCADLNNYNSHNGQITGYYLLFPQQDGAGCQGGGLVLNLIATSYMDVTFCDSTNNICVSWATLVGG
jgi:hypothetical protein